MKVSALRQAKDKKGKFFQIRSDLKVRLHFAWLENYLSGGPSYPLCLEIDPANRCPLRCSHCFWRGKNAGGQTLGRETLLSLVRQASELGVQSIIWAGGGEPLSNPSTCEAVELAAELGIQNGLFTNGLLLTPDKVAALAGALAWVRFHIPDVELFEKIQPHIRQLSSAATGQLDLGAGTAVNPWNLQEVLALPARLAGAGVGFFQAKPDLRFVHSRKYAGWWRKEVAPRFASLRAELHPELKVVIGDPFFGKSTAEKCHAHHLVTAVEASGNVAFCKLRRYEEATCLGNVYQNDLSEIFRGSRHQELARQISSRACAHCCPYSGINDFVDDLVGLKKSIDPRQLCFL